jgi:hypothetical protein
MSKPNANSQAPDIAAARRSQKRLWRGLEGNTILEYVQGYFSPEEKVQVSKNRDSKAIRSHRQGCRIKG